VIVGGLLLVIALGVTLASPLFAIVVAGAAIVAFLVVRALRRQRTPPPGSARVPATEETAPPARPAALPAERGVMEPTPDPEVDRRAAESLPASGPPATH
jgi:hypothetical protein